MNKKTVLFFTGSRADYGLLKPLIIRFSNDKSLNTKIVIGGHHFSKLFGYSYKEIINIAKELILKFSLYYLVRNYITLYR